VGLCKCGFCNEWVCVCVDFVMCGYEYVWVFKCLCLCMGGFCSVWVCVCVVFVMCGCVQICVL